MSLEKPLLILGVSLALTICELRTTMAQLGGGLAQTVCELRTTIAQPGGLYSSDCLYASHLFRVSSQQVNWFDCRVSLKRYIIFVGRNTFSHVTLV